MIHRSVVEQDSAGYFEPCCPRSMYAGRSGAPIPFTRLFCEIVHHLSQKFVDSIFYVQSDLFRSLELKYRLFTSPVTDNGLGPGADERPRRDCGS
jgi:hypothetical protein